MFVLLPTAAISCFKRTFIFLICAYTTCVAFTFRCHLFILSNDRIESDNAVANNSTLFNEMKFGDRVTTRDAQQPGTTPFNSSHLSPLTAVLRFGSPGKVCCRWEPCLWKLYRVLQLLATLEHPKALHPGPNHPLASLHSPLWGHRVHVHLSPVTVTDDLIELYLLKTLRW